MDSADSLQSLLKGVAHLHPSPALSGTSIPASPSHWLFSGLPDVSALRCPARSRLRHLWLLLLRFWELLPQRITGFCCRCCFLSLFRSQLKCYSSKRLGLTTRLQVTLLHLPPLPCFLCPCHPVLRTASCIFICFSICPCHRKAGFQGMNCLLLLCYDLEQKRCSNIC